MEGKRTLVAATLLFAVFSASCAVAHSSASPRPIDPTIVKELHSQGITVTPLDDHTGVVEPTTAARAARANFGFARGVVPSETLVRFTDRYARGGGSKQDYVNRKAWVVTFPKVQMPLLGGPIRSGGDAGSDSHPANLLVFVDAVSGRYIEALSFGLPS